MKILVDADSCPVKEPILEIAKKYRIEVLMFFDSSHQYESTYAKVFIVDKGKDSVDFVLIKYIEAGDIVITTDFGLASLALTKGAKAMNQDGLIIHDQNIDQILYNRYLSTMARNAKIRMKGPKKRTNMDDEAFIKNFLKLIEKEVM